MSVFNTTLDAPYVRVSSAGCRSRCLFQMRCRHPDICSDKQRGANAAFRVPRRRGFGRNGRNVAISESQNLPRTRKRKSRIHKNHVEKRTKLRPRKVVSGPLLAMWRNFRDFSKNSLAPLTLSMFPMPLQPQPKPLHHTISIRPVTIKARRQLQFTYSGVKSQSSKNLEGAAAEAELASVLGTGNLSSVQLRTGEEDVNVQVSAETG